ncbi:hypothetical protein L9F63_022687, partial [Diploptera punctata]
DVGRAPLFAFTVYGPESGFEKQIFNCTRNGREYVATTKCTTRLDYTVFDNKQRHERKIPASKLETIEYVLSLPSVGRPSVFPVINRRSSKKKNSYHLSLTRADLYYPVLKYLDKGSPGVDLKEEDGSTFRGFIRVHMNLFRPISVIAGTRPPSIYDILKDDETLDKTLTSFYLPRDTVKALHVTSETTTHEVIRALLKKFKVVDNPQKFALYERYYEQGETAKVKMRRIAENEKPLVLALRWSRETNCNKMFVLQENETGDILWEAFTLPELNNFLRILDREEEEYKKMVKKKYEVLGRKIQEAMERLKPAQEKTIDDEDNHM